MLTDHTYQLARSVLLRCETYAELARAAESVAALPADALTWHQRDKLQRLLSRRERDLTEPDPVPYDESMERVQEEQDVDHRPELPKR